MEVLFPRCAGLDVSKRDVTVCVRVQGSGEAPTQNTVTRWGATTRQILALRDHLLAERVGLVVIESTGVYWKPFYLLLEDVLRVALANSRDVKAVPGRKTDVADAVWLAELGAHGLVRASFVPPAPVRQLRQLLRSREAVVEDRTRDKQRLEKVLEDAGIKLSSVVTDLLGVSGWAILAAMADGETDPERLARLARGRLRAKREQLVEALTGRFTAHHAQEVAFYLKRIAFHNACLAERAAVIEAALATFRVREQLLLTSIPGVSHQVARCILAETGGDMAVFPTPQRLCSWAGVAPGIYQSGPKSRPARTRPGNRHLRRALGQAALNVARHTGTALHARYRRLATRRGNQRALVATERSILTAAWHVLSTGQPYHDPGPQAHAERDRNQRRARAIRELEHQGFTVTLSPQQKTG